MPLTIDYSSLTAGIVNYLRANSSSIDSNLVLSITTIKAFNPEGYHLYGSQFPAISVDLKSHDEERSEIGQGSLARREVKTTFEIGCHIRAIASYSACIIEMQRLVSNVEGALRLDDTLSSTFSWVDIISAEFGNVIGDRGNFQKNGMIVLEGTNFVD